MNEFLYLYSLSAVVEVRDWAPVTSFTDGRELKIRFLRKVVSMIFSNIEKFGVQIFLDKLVGIYVSPVSQFWSHTSGSLRNGRT